MADDNGDLTVLDQDGAGLLSTVGSWLTGIPKVFQRPMLKAAGRLLYGLVNVPASALDVKAEDVKHRERMRKKVREALVAKAIEQLPERPDLADRALGYFVADLIGKQQNREKVFEYAADSLSQPSSAGGQQASSVDLDDEWLGSFARHAENASSERLRMLFGRVLAGAIRHAGSYSMFTLDFLSKLGQRDAEAIIQAAPFVIGNWIILTPSTNRTIDFTLASVLGALNIVTATSIGVSNALTTFKTAPGIFRNMSKSAALLSTESQVFIIATDEAKEISFSCILLTHIGQEVLKLHVCDVDTQMLGEFSANLKSQDAELHVGEISDRRATSIAWRNLRLVTPTPLETP